MQAAIERRQQLDLKYGKINEVQAMQMMKKLKPYGFISGRVKLILIWWKHYEKAY